MENDTLTKSKLIDEIFNKTSKNRSDIQIYVDIILDIMKNAIKDDGYLLISGFGKFEKCKKYERKGRNPATGDTIQISQRNIVKFRISAKLRSELNKSNHA